MKKAKIDHKPLVYLGQNPRSISPNLEIMNARYEGDVRWRVHVIIGENTTARELRSAWKQIEKARDWLEKLQGGDPDSFSTAFLAYVLQQKEEESYSSLSMEMNFYALMLFLWITESKEDNIDNIVSSMEGKYYFKELLRTFQMKDNEIVEWIESGRDNQSDSELPWTLKTGPITVRRVTDTLLQFKKKLDNEEIVLSKDLNTSLPFAIRHRCVKRGIWQKAEELIRQRAPKEHQKFAARLNLLVQINIMLEKTNETEDLPMSFRTHLFNELALKDDDLGE